MNPYLHHIETGTSLPFNNPHAVSVSLPTLNDIIGYEEKDPLVIEKMQTGYPRFFVNRFVARLVEWIREKYRIPSHVEILAVMDEKALETAQSALGFPLEIITDKTCGFIAIERNHPRFTLVKDHIRQAGLFLSSRKAEDVLHTMGVIGSCFTEESSENGNEKVTSLLNEAYATGEEGQVLLASCGMNAIYAVFEAVMKMNSPKRSILQTGCLYVDSEQLIKRISGKELIVPFSSDTDQIRAMLALEHEHIAAVFTEVPNNPLLDCVDLPELHSICRQYDIPLIVDATFGTPHNLNVLPWCDLAVESLTKFACGHGDSIMGAVVLNPNSSKAQDLKGEIARNIIEPYARDCNRLAIGMADYEWRMKIIADNTRQIISYLEASPVVADVYSVLRNPGYGHFQKIQKHPDALPGLISVMFTSELGNWYDRLPIPKGPSLGTNFTLAMPYVYLAHYDLLKTKAGKRKLQQMGLPAELLRFSIGLETPGEIIDALKQAGI